MAGLIDTLQPEARALVTGLADNIKALLALHDKKHETVREIIKLALREIRTSRPRDYRGDISGNRERDKQRAEVIALLEAVLAQAPPDLPVRLSGSSDAAVRD